MDGKLPGPYTTHHAGGDDYDQTFQRELDTGCQDTVNTEPFPTKAELGGLVEAVGVLAEKSTPLL